MKSAEEIVAAKFSDLVKRHKQDGGLKNFSEAEKAIWYLISVRCDIDMDGFEEIFFVTFSREGLPRDELLLFIAILYKLDALSLASCFSEILNLLDKHDAWTSFKNAKTYGDDHKFFSDLPEPERLQFKTLEKQVIDRDDLWGLDEKLLAWFIEESKK